MFAKMKIKYKICQIEGKGKYKRNLLILLNEGVFNLLPSKIGNYLLERKSLNEWQKRAR